MKKGARYILCGYMKNERRQIGRRRERDDDVMANWFNQNIKIHAGHVGLSCHPFVAQLERFSSLRLNKLSLWSI